MQTSDSDALILDPTAANSLSAFTFTVPVYEKLVKYGLGKDGKYPGPDLMAGEVAKSWELSPDGLTLTFKLSTDHKFDPRPPTSSRVLDAGDVKFSWDRMAAVSSFRGEIVNSASPAGPVSSVTTPDNQTVVVKLAYPYAPSVEMFAYYPYLNILPVEADGKFNPRQEMRGSGPFRLTEYVPSSHWVYTKNTDWYVKAVRSSMASAGRSFRSTPRPWRSSRQARSGTSTTSARKTFCARRKIIPRWSC